MKKTSGTIRTVRDAIRFWRMLENILIVVMCVIFGLAGLALIISGQWEHAIIGIVILGIVAWAFHTRFKDRRKIQYTCGRCSLQWKAPQSDGDFAGTYCPRCRSDDVSN